MPRRLLNIASIVCLVLCVALMGMWVRSYCSIDELHVHMTDSRGFASSHRIGQALVSAMQHLPHPASGGADLQLSNPSRYGSAGPARGPVSC